MCQLSPNSLCWLFWSQTFVPSSQIILKGPFFPLLRCCCSLALIFLQQNSQLPPSKSFVPPSCASLCILHCHTSPLVCILANWLLVLSRQDFSSPSNRPNCSFIFYILCHLSQVASKSTCTHSQTGSMICGKIPICLAILHSTNSVADWMPTWSTDI